MILRKLVFCFSILVCVNILGMVTPKLTSGSGEAVSQPVTPERGNRTPVQPDTGGDKSAVQSPAREGIFGPGLGEDMTVLLNNLRLQIVHLQNSLEHFDEHAVDQEFSARSQFLGSDMKSYGKNDFVMAYVLTEILCECKKSLFYRKEDDVCKADVYSCDVDTLTRCAQRILASLVVGCAKGFLASHVLKYGVKALVATHFLMQSLECLFDYLNLHECFEYDKKCYMVRMFMPEILFSLKMLIKSSPEDLEQTFQPYLSRIMGTNN